MDASAIEAAIAESERALAAGARPDLRGSGFWRAVEAAKRRPEWTARFAERIADVDRRAFLRRSAIVLPLWVGVALLALGTLAGIALLAAAFALDPTRAGVAVLLGTGALVAATHDLAHLVVGGLVGIRFSHAYVEVPRRPQPGVKIDYASYLRAAPRSRAWMHASGAIVTKVIPFLGVAVALAVGAPTWAIAILLVLGIAQLLTDALFSVRVGDWKKFRRELRHARRG